jgi:hypothetical protein
MKQGYAISLAVVGIAACTALFAVNNLGKPVSLYQAFTEEDSEFMKYVAKFGKSYENTEEFAMRSEIFKNNLGAIVMHNSMDAGQTYQLGLNQFSDWTQEEYESILGTNPTLKMVNEVKYFDQTNIASIDWRAEGKVNAVKD